jgi:hypothetical protein
LDSTRFSQRLSSRASRLSAGESEIPPHRQQAACAVLLRMKAIRGALDEKARPAAAILSMEIDIESA